MRLFLLATFIVFSALLLPGFAADSPQEETAPKIDYAYALVLDEGMNSGKLYLPHPGSRVQLTILPLFFYDMPANDVRFLNAIQGKALAPGESAPWPASGWVEFDTKSLKLELVKDGRAAILEFRVPERQTIINIGWFYHHWNSETFNHRANSKTTSLSIVPDVPFSEFVKGFGLPYVPTVTPETQ